MQVGDATGVQVGEGVEDTATQRLLLGLAKSAGLGAVMEEGGQGLGEAGGHQGACFEGVSKTRNVAGSIEQSENLAVQPLQRHALQL